MITFRDKIALYGCCLGPAQILGVCEFVVFGSASLLSAAKICFGKIEEAYNRSSCNKKFDIQMKIATESQTLNNRVYETFIAIITIIPLGGISRYFTTIKEQKIKALLDAANRLASQDSPNSFKIAYKKYKEASDMGSLEADYFICFYAPKWITFKQTISEDISKLLHKTADRGHAEAQYLLASHYATETFLQLSKDLKKSFELLSKSALQGHKTAMKDLGLAYYNGDGVESSNELAKYWFEQAKKFGHPDGQKYCNDLEQEINK